MQAIIINVESNLTPIDLEALKQKLTATATRWIRAREKKQEPKLSDFFGMFGSNPEDANKSYKELRDEMMKEKYGI